MGASREGRICLSDFPQSEKGKILACPEGHAPVRIRTRNHRHNVAFDSACCNRCPRLGDCPVKPGSKYHYLRYDDKAMRTANRRAKEQTDEFKDRYRWRSGIEATFSAWDRKMSVKQLRVRGMVAVRFSVMLKAIGINILRATSVWNALGTTGIEVFATVKTPIGRIILVFKERFVIILAQLTEIFMPLSRIPDFELRIAT